MKNQAPKPHKLNRAVRVLLLPGTLILLLMGWSLFWVGQRKPMANAAKSNSHNDVTFTVLMPKQNQLND